MKQPNIIKDKSFLFAIEIVNLSKLLLEQREFVLSKQVLRSGTALELWLGSQSKQKVKEILFTNYLFR